MTKTAKRTTLAAAVAFAVVLAGVIWLVADRTTASKIPGAPAGNTASQRRPSRCGLIGTPGEARNIRTHWESAVGWLLPVSTSDGPGRRSPTGAWWCYAQTPTGAVLAGYVIAMRADGVAEDWQSVVRQQTVPGAAQTRKLQSAPEQASTQPVTLRGFTVSGYSDTHATISYYLHTPTLEASCTTNVAWYDGDWRVQLEDDGSTSSGCVQGVPANFTPWGPPT